MNPNKETASNAQIMFLVLNTSGLTIVLVSVMALLAAKDAVNPPDIFLSILLSSDFVTLAGLIDDVVGIIAAIFIAWLFFG